MPARFLAVLGGTFDRLHRGHEALLAAAFRSGDSVAIGVTTDRFLAAHRKPDAARLEPYAVRARRLHAWLRRHYPGRRWRTVPLDDVFGGSVARGVGALVVSADTLAGGRAVNRERRRRGLPVVPLVVVPLVLADDLRPISSRRIRAGEIDRDGHRLSPIEVGLAVERPADGPAAARGVRNAFPTARLTLVGFAGRGALAPRTRSSARIAAAGRDLGVALARDRGRSFLVSVAAGRIALDPRRGSQGVSAGVRRALRPPVPRKGFA